MILTDREIRMALEKKQLEISPMPDLESAISSTAIDLTLSRTFVTWGKSASMTLTPGQPGYKFSELLTFQEKHDGEFVLEPKSFVLAWTNERIAIPVESRIAARVEGKSSLARLGVGIHVTAPIIHSGFQGNVQLEVFNLGPYRVALTPGMFVCQLVFEMTSGTPEKGYAGIFSNQSESGLA